MAAEQPQLLFDLFDSYWFAHQIFNKPQTPPSKSPEPAAKTSQNLDFSSVPTINIRCHSDQLSLNSKHQKFISDSPNSVLNLQTPKEVEEEEEEKEVIIQVKNKSLNRDERTRMKNIKNKNTSKSKSLSELEFEELKGFMDLGFLFSEKDKDTNLVSIIPGLQRLGKDEKEQVNDDCVNVSRPYLSEAWGDMEKIKEEASRLIRIPVLGNEADVKNQLRFWAHSVASVVR
ncbi:hypothetical protein Hdeb2414_s0008g00290271 [Helianthus debilis subsp. tardiflorus]